MGRACSTYSEKRNACRLLVGKPERNRQLGSPKHRLMDIIKMDFRERIRWYGLELSGS
jgi:hypothetical protein